MTTIQAWNRTPWWDWREAPFEDDGFEAERVAAVSQLPVTPRMRRALEIVLRERCGPTYFERSDPVRLGRALRRLAARQLRTLREERLEAEERAAIEARKERLRLIPLKDPTRGR